MLDSNTDRSYFMIGAVIVGAAIIAGALWLFGDVLFAEGGYIDNIVSNIFGQATDATEGIGGGE